MNKISFLISISLMTISCHSHSCILPVDYLYIIRGKITNQQNTGIDNVKINIKGTNNKMNKTIYSDANGEFYYSEIWGKNPPEYTLEFVKDTYKTITTDVTNDLYDKDGVATINVTMELVP